MSTENIIDNAGPVAAMEAAGKSFYLGNAEVVSRLIRTFVDTAIQRRAGKATFEAEAALEAEEAMALSKIFLGKDPKYTPVPAFNRVGGIDEFVRQYAEVVDTHPEHAVANAILGALYGVLKILGSYEGAPEEQWGWQIQGLLETYEQVFLGVPLVEDPE